MCRTSFAACVYVYILGMHGCISMTKLIIAVVTESVFLLKLYLTIIDWYI